MSILVNTKIDRKLYESTAITDEYPDSRQSLIKSLVYFGLGYVTTSYQPLILPLFVGYQFFDYKPFANTVTDSKEYALGMLVGGLIDPYTSKAGQVPTFMKLKEMGMI